jgi:hypothetical protein
MYIVSFLVDNNKKKITTIIVVVFNKILKIKVKN